MKRIVVALGGNALLCRGEAAEAETQRRNVVRAAASLAELADDYQLVTAARRRSAHSPTSLRSRAVKRGPG